MPIRLALATLTSMLGCAAMEPLPVVDPARDSPTRAIEQNCIVIADIEALVFEPEYDVSVVWAAMRFVDALALDLRESSTPSDWEAAADRVIAGTLGLETMPSWNHPEAGDLHDQALRLRAGVLSKRLVTFCDTAAHPRHGEPDLAEVADCARQWLEHADDFRAIGQAEMGLFNAGLWYAEAGELEQARAAFERLLAEFPTGELATSARAELEALDDRRP